MLLYILSCISLGIILMFLFSVLISIIIMFIFYRLTGGKLTFSKWYKKMFTFKHEREE